MKGSTAATFCVSLFAAWASAAPVAATSNELPSQSSQSSPAGTNVRHRTHQAEKSPKVKSFSFLAHSRVSTEKKTKVLVAEDGRRIQLPDNLAGAKSWETPNVVRFLTSLTHPKKQSPFPDSSIMTEETRANMIETEPQETIVELETKAERDSWTYLPYMSKDKVLRFHCVRKAADTAIFAIPMVAAAMFLLVLSSILRYTSRAFGLCSKKGAIRLQDEEKATSNQVLSVACQPDAPSNAPPANSIRGPVHEKGEEL
ncbi:hypothetical protein M426DRAFT_168812 [Hypoxylon sp. CI-4A]|nr:hypothetical protein M426DRAFT_168812 [Hypoxylon sp. CI-4A]